MSSSSRTLGFVRRGYSRSGGAEAYLKRLAQGVAERGHAVRLFTTAEWPETEWSLGEITRVHGTSPRAFADELTAVAAAAKCDVLMSLERVWKCDVYRAGDGVHAGWLQRRAKVSTPWRNFVRRLGAKHDELVDLEGSLFARGGARRVIVNSTMVRDEIVKFYGYPAERIHLVRNGVPVAAFAAARLERTAARSALGLGPSDLAVLFVGSGWERKGLRYAVEAVDALGGDARLLIAGRGQERRYSSARTQFLGERDPTALYGAADIFLAPTLYDPFSNACLEALASGLPVITSTANGFAEIMENGVHGSRLDDPTDTRAMAEALRFWADAARRESALAKNLELAANYDIAANVRRTLEILLQTAESAAST